MPEILTIGSRPSTRIRLLVATAIGMVGGVISAVKVAQVGHTSDFSIFWIAGRAVIEGASPYSAVYTGVRPWILSGFLYPFPAAIAVAPLAVFPERVAASLFSGLGVGILAFVMTRDGWNRLPVLMSFPMLMSLTAGQWAPFFTAAAFAPAMAWAAVCKPNMGLAAFAARPSWRFVLVAIGILAVSFAIRPSWPSEWWTSLQTALPGSKVAPVMVPGGVLLVLAGLRWRRAEARLLVALACIPQTMLLYDQLMLAPIAGTRREALVMGLWSYAVPVLAYVALRDRMPTTESGSFVLLARMVVWGYYLPALGLVLRRSNEGPALPWVERAVGRWLPTWLRGTSGESAVAA
jgi:hypothetical protein